MKPSPSPDSWKLWEIFGTGIVLGSYMGIMTVIFFWAAWETTFFSVSACDPAPSPGPSHPAPFCQCCSLLCVCSCCE